MAGALHICHAFGAHVRGEKGGIVQYKMPKHVLLCAWNMCVSAREARKDLQRSTVGPSVKVGRARL